VVQTPLFRSLKHSSFRRFFIGQAISIQGNWLQQIALAWLVYRTTGSALLLGVVAFANQAPILFIAPFSGLLADRLDRRKLLIATQGFAALQALLLATLTLGGWIEPWHIVALALVYGVILGLDTPVRHSLFVDLLDDRADLPNAIALNSFLMNSGRLIGPSIAGIALIFIAEGWCFLINALSYLAMLWVAWTLAPAPPKAASRIQGLFASLREGLGYAWHTRGIRRLLALVACIGFFGSSYLVLMPVFARDVFGGGSETLGFLVGCAGFGAVLGTAWLATRGSVDRLAGRLRYTAALAGSALLLVGLSPTVWMAYPLMACLGFGIIVTAASANMLLQSLVDDDKRGRIVSFYAMAFMGIMPFGSLTAGSLANQIGAPATATLFGLCCLLLGLAIGWRIGSKPPPRSPG
jgi:MFS family permease